MVSYIIHVISPVTVFAHFLIRWSNEANCMGLAHIHHTITGNNQSQSISSSSFVLILSGCSNSSPCSYSKFIRSISLIQIPTHSNYHSYHLFIVVLTWIVPCTLFPFFSHPLWMFLSPSFSRHPSLSPSLPLSLSPSFPSSLCVVCLWVCSYVHGLVRKHVPSSFWTWGCWAM